MIYPGKVWFPDSRLKYDKHVAIPVRRFGRDPTRPMPSEYWCYLGPAALESIRDLLVGLLEAKPHVFPFYNEPWQISGLLDEVGAKLWLSHMADVTWLPALQTCGKGKSKVKAEKSDYADLWTYNKSFPRAHLGFGDVKLFIDPKKPSQNGGAPCNGWAGLLVEGILESPDTYGRLYVKLLTKAMTGNDQERSSYQSEKVSLACLDHAHFGGHKIEIGDAGAIVLNQNEGDFFFGKVTEIKPDMKKMAEQDIPINKFRAISITVTDEHGRSCQSDVASYSAAYKTRDGNFMPIQRILDYDKPFKGVGFRALRMNADDHA